MSVQHFVSAALRQRAITSVVIASLAGLGIGLLLTPRAPTPSDKKPEPIELQVLGKPLALNDTASSKALGRVRRHVTRRIRW